MTPLHIEEPMIPAPVPSAVSRNGDAPVIPAPVPAAVSRNGHSPVAHKPRRRRWFMWAAIALVVVMALAAPGLFNRPAPAPVPATSSQALTAHGVVQPVARASIATMNGGVLDQLPVQIGARVEAQQILASVRLSGQAEMLVAPWRGTVTGVSVNLGDTLQPGTTVATIGDLSRYQIETTDLDQYLIGYVKPAQPVSMTVEALDQMQLHGLVKSVGLEQQHSASGSNYPVVIDLAEQNPNLRPGMTVRIIFKTEPSN